MGQIKNIKLHIVTDIKIKYKMLASLVRRVKPVQVCSVRNIQTTQTSKKHTLPDLPYDYNALEPVISAEIMQLHHGKHHATYVNNLNVAEEQLAEAQQKGDVSKIISLAPALRGNGGGEPEGDLLAAINRDFGSLDNMKTKLSGSTVAVQGSGWGWLGYDKAAGRLAIATCANQDPLEATTGLVPMLGIDVWEHAYYLQYKNVRPDYVKAIFDVVNWDNVAQSWLMLSEWSLSLLLLLLDLYKWLI